MTLYRRELIKSDVGVVSEYRYEPVEPVKREDIQRIMVEYDGYRDQYPVPSLSDTVDALMALMVGEDSTP